MKQTALPGFEEHEGPVGPSGHRNPCVRVYGLGPAGATCKTCTRLIAYDYPRKTFYKCPLRGITHGPGTDHRLKWEACARYEEETKDGQSKAGS